MAFTAVVLAGCGDDGGSQEADPTDPVDPTDAVTSTSGDAGANADPDVAEALRAIVTQTGVTDGHVFAESDSGEVNVSDCPVLPPDSLSTVADVLGYWTSEPPLTVAEVHGPHDAAEAAVFCAFNGDEETTDDEEAEVVFNLTVLIPTDATEDAWLSEQAEGEEAVPFPEPVAGGSLVLTGDSTRFLWTADSGDWSLAVLAGPGGDPALVEEIVGVLRAGHADWSAPQPLPE